MKIEPEPGPGHSTRQIVAAPRRSIYICDHHDQLPYLRALARHLGRGDLAFVAATTGLSPSRVRGWCMPIVLDHAAKLSVETVDDLKACRPGLVPQVD